MGGGVGGCPCISPNKTEELEYALKKIWFPFDRCCISRGFH